MANFKPRNGNFMSTQIGDIRSLQNILTWRDKTLQFTVYSTLELRI